MTALMGRGPLPAEQNRNRRGGRISDLGDLSLAIPWVSPRWLPVGLFLPRQ
ncbi:MAG: hypothetical protein R3B96_15095 [Pirellulaceae bacterium]